MRPAVIQPATFCLAGDVRYLEFAPPAELAELVECFYLLQTDDPCQASYPVVADGCADWLFDCRGEREALATLSLSQPLHFQLPAAMCLLGLRLRPGGLQRLLRGAAAIRDGHGYALAELPLRLAGLARRRRVDPGALLRELTDRLGEVALRQQPESERLIHDSLLHFDDPAGPDAPPLAATLGLSERHFRRLFTEQIGVSPQRYRRVRRFQNSLRELLRQPQRALATIAAEHGYSDQAHMSHDWRALSNLAPSAWRGRFLQDVSPRLR